MPGFAAFEQHLTALYRLYPILDGIWHPADLYIREFLARERFAAWWVTALKRSNPALHAMLSCTLGRLDEEAILRD